MNSILILFIFIIVMGIVIMAFDYFSKGEKNKIEEAKMTEEKKIDKEGLSAEEGAAFEKGLLGGANNAALVEFIGKIENNPDNFMAAIVYQMIKDMADLKISMDTRFSAIGKDVESLRENIEDVKKTAMTGDKLVQVFDDMYRDMKDGSFWKGTSLEIKKSEDAQGG